MSLFALETLKPNDYPTLIGIPKIIFEYVFLSYCGPWTPVKTLDSLFVTLFYLKVYPSLRVVKCLLHMSSAAQTFKYLTRCITHLAGAMSHLLNDEWERRHGHHNMNKDIEEFFGIGTYGYVDTFPIFVRRPKNSTHARYLYQGKYKSFIVKIQMIASHEGVPMFLSGPHIGVRSDIKIWRNAGPWAGGLESEGHCLGDKAYVSGRGIICPYKRRVGHDLNRAEKDYNLIHSWFRASIEHVFSQMKKFNIIGETYRGRVMCDGGCRIRNIVNVIAALVVLQTRRKPLKDLTKMILDEDEESLISDAVMDLKQRPRTFVRGYPLGEVDDLIFEKKNDDGSIIMVGAGPEPSHVGLNFGLHVEDVKSGDMLLVWRGYFWRATVRYVSEYQKTVHIRWMRDGTITPYYPIRLCVRL